MGNFRSCKSDYKNFGSNWIDGQICKVRLIAQYNKELFFIGKDKDMLKNSYMMGITLENSNMLMLRIVKYPSWFLFAFEGFDHENLEKTAQFEGLNASVDGKYSPFLCILTLFSIIGFNINCVYPASKYVKYVALYNQIIRPCNIITTETINILWCSTNHDVKQKPNHFLPLSSKNIVVKNDDLPKKLKQQ